MLISDIFEFAVYELVRKAAAGGPLDGANLIYCGALREIELADVQLNDYHQQLRWLGSAVYQLHLVKDRLTQPIDSRASIEKEETEKEETEKDLMDYFSNIVKGLKILSSKEFPKGQEILDSLINEIISRQALLTLETTASDEKFLCAIDSLFPDSENSEIRQHRNDLLSLKDEAEKFLEVRKLGEDFSAWNGPAKDLLDRLYPYQIVMLPRISGQLWTLCRFLCPEPLLVRKYVVPAAGNTNSLENTAGQALPDGESQQTRSVEAQTLPADGSQTQPADIDTAKDTDHVFKLNITAKSLHALFVDKMGNDESEWQIFLHSRDELLENHRKHLETHLQQQDKPVARSPRVSNSDDTPNGQKRLRMRNLAQTDQANESTPGMKPVNGAATPLSSTTPGHARVRRSASRPVRLQSPADNVGPRSASPALRERTPSMAPSNYVRSFRTHSAKHKESRL